VSNTPSSDPIERRYTLFPPAALEDHAEAVGVIEREGKLQILPPVWSFAFGLAIGESRTLAAFHRSYNSRADESLSPGGYYQRLTPSLAEYLRDLVECGLNEVAVPHHPLLLNDSTRTEMATPTRVHTEIWTDGFTSSVKN